MLPALGSCGGLAATIVPPAVSADGNAGIVVLVAKAGAGAVVVVVVVATSQLLKSSPCTTLMAHSAAGLPYSSSRCGATCVQAGRHSVHG